MSPLKSLLPVSLKFGSGLTGDLAWGKLSVHRNDSKYKS